MGHLYAKYTSQHFLSDLFLGIFLPTLSNQEYEREADFTAIHIYE
jgi:hypothetical protein